MADITNLLNALPSRYEFQQPIWYQTYVIDVTDPDFAGIEAIGTHELITVPEGMAVVLGHCFIEDSFTSGGAATVQLLAGTEALTGALALADIAEGKTFEFLQGKGATDTQSLYFKSAADTIDMTVAVADLTAGKIVMIVGFVDVNAVLTNG